jgi:hypothetical protein
LALLAWPRESNCWVNPFSIRRALRNERTYNGRQENEIKELEQSLASCYTAVS